MALPKLATPLYDVVCPSGLKVSFRPFLVKEEKLLMIAMQSDETPTILNSAKLVLENCVGAISGIDIDKLPLFDVEFLFLNLRARSIGEVVPLKYKCNQKVIDANTNQPVTCDTVSEYAVNLLEIKPTFGTGHSKYIQLTDSIGITLRYPTFKSFRGIAKKDLPADEAFAFLVDCIESINDTDHVVLTKDVTPEEVSSFVDDMNKQQVEKLDAFFDTMPKIEKAIHFKCPKCLYEEEIVVKGLDNFFV
jgi:hypothetical protein